MRTLFDTFLQTMRTLWAHKLRSFLTMFGIAWGVGSLLLLVGVGEGFRNGNRKQLETFGKNIIFFFGGRQPAVEGSFSSMRWFNLTYDDYVAIKNESKLALSISPLIARDDIRAVSEYTSTNGQVSGVPPVYNQVRTIPLQVGRWINDEDNEQRRRGLGRGPGGLRAGHVSGAKSVSGAAGGREHDPVEWRALRSGGHALDDRARRAQ